MVSCCELNFGASRGIYPAFVSPIGASRCAMMEFDVSVNWAVR